MGHVPKWNHSNGAIASYKKWYGYIAPKHVGTSIALQEMLAQPTIVKDIPATRKIGQVVKFDAAQHYRAGVQYLTGTISAVKWIGHYPHYTIKTDTQTYHEVRQSRVLLVLDEPCKAIVIWQPPLQILTKAKELEQAA